MIEIENLTKRFGAKTAVDGVTLRIEPGEVFAFLGPNGAGKTTTMRLVAGLLRPSAGTVRVAGHDVAREPEAAKARMAYVPDEPFIYETLTGREFLTFVAGLYGLDRKTAARRIEELARRFDFADYMDELSQGYSHGMSQRIVVASALIHEPDALLIDEPFVGLDPLSSRRLKDAFRELTARGSSVFLSTHTLSLAGEVAGRIGIMSRGRLVAVGAPAEIARGGDLEEAFLDATAPPETR